MFAVTPKSLKSSISRVYGVTAPLFLSLLFTALFLVGCGKDADTQAQLNNGTLYSAPQELRSFFDEVIREAEAHGRPLENLNVLTVLYDEDLPGGVAGRCEQIGNFQKTVRIRQSVWNRIPDGTKQSLIFHEMGHCFLALKHDDEEIEHNGKKRRKSLMSTEIVPGLWFEAYRKELLEELFSKH